jgi:hypothetical protein
MIHRATTSTSIIAEFSLASEWLREMAHRLFAAITVSMRKVFDPYRPELHYMRGPGPKWRQKQGILPDRRM